MKKFFNNIHGFTLLEIIVSIVVVTIIAVIAGNGIITIVKGYTFSRKNALTAQQGQIAMARLKKELGNIKAVTAGSATETAITFTRSSDGSIHAISWAGGNSPLLVDVDTLIGPVTSFSLTYYDSYNASASPYSASTSIIEIMLQLMGAENSPMTFTDRVNLYLETGG
jgi:prepilin-type N-terminal cleavage/methylation domain-containing protein